MINLMQKGLPNAVMVNGEPVSLNTDFRVWIQFHADVQNDSEDIDISYLFKDEIPNIDDSVLEQLLMFLYNPSATPKMGGACNDKLLDYYMDGEYIFSALYQTYGIDITEIDMHWHKFQALCNNVRGDDTIWGYAKGIRGYQKTPKNYDIEKEEQKEKLVWSFQTELTEDEKSKKKEFDSYF